MSNTLKNQACKASSGTVITGKWHKHSYRILKPLGFGANGVVYLASGINGLVALKLSDNNMSITSEVNVLKHFTKVQETSLGPSLRDVDDWYRPEFGITVPFYAMEYVKGEDFLHFVEQRGGEWTGILCSQLLLDLDRLHHAGWVFGDLKPDNLLVTGPPPKIRWLDVGGVTIQGRSIKEFTEFFDRGYWGMGSRVAEPTYDLFSVAMIIINTAYPKRFSKNMNSAHQLKQAISTHSELRRYENVLVNALEGRYTKATEMRRDLVTTMSKASITAPPAKRNRQKSTNVSVQPLKNNRQTAVRKKENKGTLETILILMFLLLAYALYIYGQLI